MTLNQAHKHPYGVYEKDYTYRNIHTGEYFVCSYDLLGLPDSEEFFYCFKSKGLSLIPEKIHEVAEYLHDRYTQLLDYDTALKLEAVFDSPESRFNPLEKFEIVEAFPEA